MNAKVLPKGGEIRCLRDGITLCTQCNQEGHSAKYCKLILCSTCLVWNDHLSKNCPNFCSLCQEKDREGNCSCSIHGADKIERLSNFWQCKTCSLVNDKNHAACRACYTPECVKNWKCSSCNRENSNDNSQCRTCDKMRIIVDVEKASVNALTPKNGFWFSRHLPCSLDGQTWNIVSNNKSFDGSWDIVSMDSSKTTTTANDLSDWDVVSTNSSINT